MMGSRESSNHGEGADLIIFDEIAQMPNLELFNTMNEATSAKPNSVTMAFSTLSSKVDNPMTELIKLHKQAANEGRPLNNWLVKVWQGNPDADPYTDEQIHAANPSAAHLPALFDAICKDREKAKLSDQFKSRYMTYRLNCPGHAAHQLVNAEHWRQCIHPQGTE